MESGASGVGCVGVDWAGNALGTLKSEECTQHNERDDVTDRAEIPWRIEGVFDERTF